MSLDVFLLPTLTSAEELTDRTVVVIDVLRATTTITKALAVGAKEVIPVLEVDEALRMSAEMVGHAVLGGERGGRRIDGFDLGNSPIEFTAESVGGKTVVFTTTNGTRAMQLCRRARRVLIGAFSNLSAVVNELRSEREIALLCAGTLDRVSREDVLLAGAILHRLVGLDPRRFRPIELAAVPGQYGERWNDEAFLAYSAWGETESAEREVNLFQRLLASRGGRNLFQLGMVDDIRFAAKVDSLGILGELNLLDWRIRALNRGCQE